MQIRLSVSTKIIGGFLTVLAVCGVAIGAGIYALNQTSQNVNQYEDTAYDALLASELNADMAKVLLFTNRYISTRADKDLAQSRKYLGKMVEGVDLAKKEIHKPERAERIAKIDGSLGSFAAGLDRLVELYLKRDELVHDHVHRDATEIRRALTEINEGATADDDYETANLAAIVQEDFLTARVYAEKFLQSNSPEHADRLAEEMDEVEHAIERLEKSIENPARIAIIAELRPLLLDFSQSIAGLVTLIDERNQVRNETIETVGLSVSTWATEIKNSAVADEKAMAKSIAADIKNSNTFSMISAATAVVIGVGIAIFVSLGISRPVLALADNVSKLAKGQTDNEVPVQTRGDEIGEMARAIEILRQGAAERSNMANDLANRVEREVGELLDAVAAASSELGATAENMKEAAERNRITAIEVADVAEQSSSNVQTVATASEELAASSSEISSKMSAARELTHKADTQSNSASVSMNDLDKLASTIGEIVELITNIAEQTNLLALNATIESARAGDAGKGFAVVAQEVKTLANQTSSSSEEIRAQIVKLQEAASTANADVSQVRDAVSSLQEIAVSVATAIEEQTASTHEIARNTHGVAEANNQVTESVGVVAASAETTNSAASEMSITSAELAKNAELLKLRFETVLQELRAA